MIVNRCVKKRKNCELHQVPGASHGRRRRHHPYWRSWARRPVCCPATGETWPWPGCIWDPWGSRNWWRSRGPAASCRPRETYCSPDDGTTALWRGRTNCRLVSISCLRRRIPSPTRGRMICSLRCKLAKRRLSDQLTSPARSRLLPRVFVHSSFVALRHVGRKKPILSIKKMSKFSIIHFLILIEIIKT